MKEDKASKICLDKLKKTWEIVAISIANYFLWKKIKEKKKND